MAFVMDILLISDTSDHRSGTCWLDGGMFDQFAGTCWLTTVR